MISEAPLVSLQALAFSPRPLRMREELRAVCTLIRGCIQQMGIKYDYVPGVWGAK